MYDKIVNTKYNWKIYYTIKCFFINNSQGSGVGTLKYAAKVKQKLEWNYVWKYAQYTPNMIKKNYQIIRICLEKCSILCTK